MTADAIHDLAIHDLAIHDLGGHGPTILYAHATGFHGLCWRPIATELPHFHHIAFDARGHGDTPIPDPEIVDWHTHGTDVVAIASELVAADPLHLPLIGVGHSMGGAAMLMAAVARPDLFRALVVFEPIVAPPNPESPPNSHFLAAGARRRRSRFESFEAAIANFSAKPPLNCFRADALDAYVRGGFRLGDDGQIHLKCTPEREAQTYEAGGLHGTWHRLGEIQTPVLVLSGRTEPGQPSGFMNLVAAAMPSARLLQLDQLNHFGPMQDPALIADLIAQLIEETDH